MLTAWLSLSSECVEIVSSSSLNLPTSQARQSCWRITTLMNGEMGNGFGSDTYCLGDLLLGDTFGEVRPERGRMADAVSTRISASRCAIRFIFFRSSNF